MTKICIYNGEELVCEYTKVISSRLTDSLSGECTFEFTITSAMAADIRAEHEIRLIGALIDYRFNIAKIEKSISNGLTICTVTCEHKSYELNNEQFEITEFEFKGNAADALELLLQGTSLKPGECDVTVPVDMKINQKCSRRAALMQLIALCCGEIEYDSNRINIRAHRGSNDVRMVMGGKSVSNLTLSADLRAATQTYGLTLYKKLDFAVGDNIRIVFRPFNLDVETRIITAEYNPFNCREISIEVGSYYPTISDDLYKIKQVANEVENKVQDLEDSTAMMKVATNGSDVSIGGLSSLIISIPYTALASTYAAFCVTVKFTLTTAGTVVFLLQKDNSEVIRYPEFFDVGEHTKTYSYPFASLQGLNTIHFSVLSSDGAVGILPTQQTWGYVLGAYLAGDEPWDGRIKVAEKILGLVVSTETITADDYSEMLTIDLINRLDLIFADRAGTASATGAVTTAEWNGEFILPYEVHYAYYIDSTHLGVKFLNPVRASSVVMSDFSAMGGVAGNLREVVIVGISSDNDTIIIETEGFEDFDTDFLVGYAKGSLLSDLDGTEISAFSLPFSKEGK